MQQLAAYLNSPIDEITLIGGFERSDFVRSVDVDDLEEGIETKVYYSLPRGGLDVVCDATGVIQTVFLYSGRTEGYGAYAGALGEGLKFSANQSEVEQVYGQPARRGGPTRDSALGDTGAWIRYDYPTHSVHFQFTLDGSALDLVTLMTVDCVPR